MTIGERIRTRRKELGISADTLAEHINVSRSTIFRYESGDIEKMPVEALQPIAKILRTTPYSLMGLDETNIPKTEANEEVFLQFDNVFPISTKKIPMLGEIACGEPIFANEDRESYVLAGTDVHADFCLKAKGDSMINARIHDGDIVFIQTQAMVENGEVAAVIIDDEATLKRVYYFPDEQKLMLSPENPSFTPLMYVGVELEKVNILGKAVAFQSDIKL